MEGGVPPDVHGLGVRPSQEQQLGGGGAGDCKEPEKYIIRLTYSSKHFLEDYNLTNKLRQNPRIRSNRRADNCTFQSPGNCYSHGKT